MAKGNKDKNLLNQTSKKSKKEMERDKYKEISDIKKEYAFSLKQQVIYIGIDETLRGQECIVIKRSGRNKTQYFNIQFNDGRQLQYITASFLKTPEDYELWLEKQNKEETENNVSDLEAEVIKNGYIPLRNKDACMISSLWVERRCNDCHFENRCIFINKGKYRKVKD